MSNENVGSVIQALRKEKKITQEALAEAIGVSGQAVSKWENGGMPDVYLIPAIADFFGVTTDKLFSRNIVNFDNIETIVAEYIASLDADKVYEAWFNLFWTSQKAALGMMPAHSMTLEQMNTEKYHEENHYSVINDEYRNGFSSLSLAENQQYAFLMRKPNDYSKLILPAEEYEKLFAALGDIDCLNVLLFLYKRENSKFTEQLLIDNLNIAQEKVQEITASLIKYEMLSAEELELDDKKMIIYSFKARYSFIPFLFFAREIIETPYKFSATSGWANGLRIN
jgi:transcriptional regulator with XRE-family HTH domain